MNVTFSVNFVQLANRRFGAEYLFRVYVIFVSQVLLAGAFVLYPGMWWTVIQLSLVISPLVVNIWNYVELPHFYPSTQSGLLFAEFLILEHFIYTRDMEIVVLCLNITFVLCTMIFIYTYITENVIGPGLPPPEIVMLLLTVSVISYFRNQFMFNVLSFLKKFIATYYIVCYWYVIQPRLIFDYVNAGIQLQLNFTLILTYVMVLLDLFV